MIQNLKIVMYFPGKERISSLLSNRLNQGILALIVLYFLCMDALLYQTVQNRTPLLSLPGNATAHSSALPKTNPFSPFNGLSVKMMMMDQMNHYVETPLAQIFNTVTQFSTRCPQISANTISFFGILFALAAARCISYDHAGLHLLAVSLMIVRGWMDALDGLVARERAGVAQFLSLHNTSGYFVDGLADTLGYTAFLVACYIYLKQYVPKQKQYLPLNGAVGEKLVAQHVTWTSRRIFFVCFCFGMQIALSSALWDRFCDKYHVLMETTRTIHAQATVQNDLLKSTMMWIIVWMWRISNSHALMNFFLGSIFVNKMWPFLLWIQYIGYAEIVILGLFTEIHLSDASRIIINLS